MKKRLRILACVAAVLLAGCGGGGGSTTPVPPPATVYPAPNALANICTPEGEKAWVRSYIDDVYLWYNEIVDVNAASYATPSDYFDALLVKSKDKFSFSLPKAQMDAVLSGAGEVSYGASFTVSPDNLRLLVAYSDPNTPASAAGLVRGTQIVHVNGAPLTTTTASAWTAALQPTAVGQTNSFDVLDPGASVTRGVTLTSALVTVTPVPQTQVITQSTGKKVGYLVFNEHIASAEAPLSAAMAQFALAQIDDLVLDLRYNPGGEGSIAAELGAMIGGAPVTGKVFLKETFNAKNQRPQQHGGVPQCRQHGEAFANPGIAAGVCADQRRNVFCQRTRHQRPQTLRHRHHHWRYHLRQALRFQRRSQLRNELRRDGSKRDKLLGSGQLRQWICTHLRRSRQLRYAAGPDE